MNKNIIIISSVLIGVSAILGFVMYKKFTKETSPKIEDLKVGDSLYPKGTNVNIRSSANVEMGNYIYPNYTGKVGTYLESVIGGDGFTWHKVKLDKPTAKSSEGFVRVDVVKKG